MAGAMIEAQKVIQLGDGEGGVVVNGVLYSLWVVLWALVHTDVER